VGRRFPVFLRRLVRMNGPNRESPEQHLRPESADDLMCDRSRTVSQGVIPSRARGAPPCLRGPAPMAYSCATTYASNIEAAWKPARVQRLPAPTALLCRPHLARCRGPA